MVENVCRRKFLKSMAVGAGLAIGMTDLPARAIRKFVSLAANPVYRVDCLDGERRLSLIEVPEGVFASAQAQWGRPATPRFNWVCDYAAQCGWLDSWNPGQVQFYWNNMAAQYAWLTAQHQQAMMLAMAHWAGLRYQLSNPYVMPAVRSVYCSGRGPASIVFGMTRRRDDIVVRDRMVVLANLVLGAMSQRSDAEEAQRSGAPQSNSRPGEIELGDQSIAAEGFDTDHGAAELSNRQLRDVDTGEQGYLAAWDTEEGKARTLVLA